LFDEDMTPTNRDKLGQLFVDMTGLSPQTSAPSSPVNELSDFMGTARNSPSIRVAPGSSVNELSGFEAAKGATSPAKGVISPGKVRPGSLTAKSRLLGEYHRDAGVALSLTSHRVCGVILPITSALF